MEEATKKILAYQQTPLILTGLQTGKIPDDFLITLTQYEQTYIDTVGRSPIEPVIYELLSRLRAAGILPTISSLLVDVHTAPPVIRTKHDKVTFPLADDPSTKRYLIDQFAQPFVQELRKLVLKTKERYGSAHIIHLDLLPRFLDGKLVSEDIVTFGEPCIPNVSHEPAHISHLYNQAIVRAFPVHTWIGINQKFFVTQSLQDELVDILQRIKASVVAQQQ